MTLTAQDRHTVIVMAELGGQGMKRGKPQLVNLRSGAGYQTAGGARSR
jgi:hypothetical protein